MDRIDQAVSAVQVACVTQAAWFDPADLVEKVTWVVKVDPAAQVDQVERVDQAIQTAWSDKANLVACIERVACAVCTIFPGYFQRKY